MWRQSYHHFHWEWGSFLSFSWRDLTVFQVTSLVISRGVNSPFCKLLRSLFTSSYLTFRYAPCCSALLFRKPFGQSCSGMRRLLRLVVGRHGKTAVICNASNPVGSVTTWDLGWHAAAWRLWRFWALLWQAAATRADRLEQSLTQRVAHLAAASITLDAAANAESFGRLLRSLCLIFPSLSDEEQATTILVKAEAPCSVPPGMMKGNYFRSQEVVIELLTFKLKTLISIQQAK